ncbi:isopentenyl-diphosphate Delta-isomerase [Microbacterium sp. E-13]|uniref:isopentenyl-diphosphate Delta-isomerase n=1 Tax=Microbacterium sp. E-13 TaxID=3404048 RepID=UPI003CF71C49
MPQELPSESAEDEVVLLDESGTPIGRAPKSAAHGPETALHLAFSCHVVTPGGQLLVTRRAISKRTWPGVWTNSFCGHPKPAEPLLHAVRRRADHELGLELESIELALPLFRYRATDAGGLVENEVCPVYVAVASSEPEPNPCEVAEYRWVEPQALATAVGAAPWAFSPWLVLQARELDLFRA